MLCARYDGCATFFRSSKFEKVDMRGLEFDDVDSSECLPDFDTHNVALLIVLRPRWRSVPDLRPILLQATMLFSALIIGVMSCRLVVIVKISLKSLCPLSGCPSRMNPATLRCETDGCLMQSIFFPTRRSDPHCRNRVFATDATQVPRQRLNLKVS